EDPLYGAVNLDDQVGEFGDAARGVCEDARRRLPEELPRAILSPRERLDALARALDVLRRVERGQFRLLPGPVFERGHVERPDVAPPALALALLVEAAPGLLAEQPPLDHARDEVREDVSRALLVFGDGLVDVPGDVCENVQSDDVECAEGRGLRAAQRRARH